MCRHGWTRDWLKVKTKVWHGANRDQFDMMVRGGRPELLLAALDVITLFEDTAPRPK
ncbi:protein of unknown function [Hyphomicrobium sp. MC1]|nr:protein of unknown function [Hyphomicrobium sp. MC1]